MIHYTGLLALLGAAAVLVDALYTIKRGKSKFGVYAKLFLLLSWLVYVYSFVIQDYSLKPVYEYSTYGLPLAFKIASSWASGGGSLFLFATVIVLIALIHERYNGDPHLAVGYDALILAAMSLAYMNGAFEYMEAAGIKAGVGLNPLLKSPWIYPHPLSTFTGYALVASSAVALFSGADRAAKTLARSGWIFLTAGIVIGGYWSYLTFGWGGYWAWDPVETAELTPWLVLTALFHAQVVGRRTSYFTQMLAAGSVFLAILVTRAGISPLHSFASPEAVTTVVTLAFTAMLMAEGFRKLGGVVEEFKSVKWSPYTTGLILSYFSLMGMFLITFSTLAVPSALKLAGVEVNVPQMDSGVQFYHTAMFPFALLLFASLPFCTLGTRLGWHELSALTTGLAVVSGVLIYQTYVRDLVWSPASSLATNLIISALLPFVVTGIFSGLGAFLLYLKERVNVLAGISFLHMAMAITMLGILLSGPYAYNRAYFKDTSLPLGERAVIGDAQVKFADFSYSLYGGKIDAYTPYVGSNIFKAASWSLLFLATDLKEALKGYFKGREKLSQSGVLELYNMTSRGALIPGEFQGVGSAVALNVTNETRQVGTFRQVLLTVRNPLVVSRMAASSREGNRTSLGVMLIGNFSIDGVSVKPTPAIMLNLTFTDPLTVKLGNGTLKVRRGTLLFFNMMTQTHSLPKLVDGTVVAPESTLLLDEATYEGVHRIEIPYQSEDDDVFLYVIFSQGRLASDVIDVIKRRGLVESLIKGDLGQRIVRRTLITPECQHLTPHNMLQCLGHLPMPRLIPEGARLDLRLEVEGSPKEVSIRFDANGEVQGIHGLVAHVVNFPSGLDEVYMVFNPPTVKEKAWSFGYHELMVYYLHETFKGLSQEERLGLAAVFSAAYLKDAVTPENLFPHFMELYDLAEGFSLNKSVLISQGAHVQAKVIPYVRLLWYGVILMTSAELYLLLISLRREVEEKGDSSPEGDGDGEPGEAPPPPM